MFSKKILHFLFLAVSMVWANVAGWLFVIFANQKLSLVEMGNLGFYTNIITLASIVSVAIGVTANRYHSLYVSKMQIKKFGYTASIGYLAFTLGIVSFAAYILLAPYWTQMFNFPMHNRILLISGLVFAIMFPVAWYRAILQSNARFQLVAIGLLLEGIAKLAIGYWASLTNDSYELFLSAMTISSLIPLLIMWALSSKQIKEIYKHPRPLKRAHLVFLYQALVQRVGVILLFTIDILFAKYYLDPDHAGIYALLSVSGKALYFITQTIYVLTTPLLSPYLEQVQKRRVIVTGILSLTAIISALIIISYLVIPHWSLGLMFGNRYQLIMPYILRYSIASSLLSITLIITLYKLLRGQFVISSMIFTGIIVEVALMIFRHDSVNDLVNNYFQASIFLTILLSLAIWYQAGKDKSQSIHTSSQV